jgi:hypothetical protein
VIDRIRRGTHDRADANGPCRGRATAVSFGAASRTSRSACPCAVLPCILHIGGANWKSRVTCDSPVLPRSPTDDPTPSRQLTCRICPDNSYGLQAEAIRGLQPRSVRSEYHGSARTGHRRRRFRRMPAAASVTRASRMHRIGSVRLAGSPAVASRPAEAARCLESRASTRTRVYHPQYAGCGENLLRTKQAHTDTQPMPASDRMGATCSRRAHPPTMSGGFSRSNARGRTDLHSPNDAWTSLTHGRPGIRQARRGTKTASSPFRQNGDSRLAATGSSGLREQIDGLGWSRANLCISTRDPREEARVGRAG